MPECIVGGWLWTIPASLTTEAARPSRMAVRHRQEVCAGKYELMSG
jgi:hypothetical protein